MHVTDYKPKQASREIRLSFTVLVQPDGDSFYAFCPAFKGLHVDGATEQQAVENAAQAAMAYVESLVAHGEPLPIGPHCVQEEQIPAVPPGAFLHHLEMQWPSQRMSGTR